MPFVACPCGKKFRATDALAGKQVNCPGCGRPLLIPQASLLDEELDRPQPLPAAAASPARTPTHQHSATIEGGLLLLLLAGGGFVVVAILWMLFSMLGGSGGGQPEGQLAETVPAEQAVNDSNVAESVPDSTSRPDNRQPELEARSPEGDSGPDRPATPSDSQPAPAAGQSPRPTEMQEPPVGDSIPPVERSREEPPSQKPARPGEGSIPSAENTIRLSAGVALAQTLPTGTAVGVSVDYEFVDNPPGSPVKLVWAVESGNGQVIKQPVEMSARGTLQGFVPQFRPEQGPFSTHIEDQSGRRLSKSLALR